ncbi:SOUL family heme-binding protein [Aurantivibrio infirmus]
MATEEPEYTVIEKSGAFELRVYAPMIVAETQTSGSLDEASDAGFKVIADYIFGNNTSRTGDGEKVSMTSPVTVAPLGNGAPESEKISMTAPVSMKQIDGQWRMHFVMPEKYTLDSLPSPNNPAVVLREVPEHKYAVLRFSGFAGEAKIAKKTVELTMWLASKGIRPTGAPEIARYDAPWTLPFFRRNEIMVRY